MGLEKSAAAFEEAKKFMPGGVNSPVRSYRSVDYNPPFIAHALGSKIYDIDGNEYIDYVGSWGPMILGHAHPAVVEALKKAVERGTSFGAPTELETELAELINKFYPSMEVMRMVNSGTEATMSAIRVARGFTGRDKIIKFIGCYHGHCDSLLVEAGSGAKTFSTPSSLGVTENIAQDTIAVPYNDLAAVEEVFAEYTEQIAAVIVEPVAGNMGLVPPKKNFLPGLRKITNKYGALLIFDEVMSGFRVALGGAQEKFKIKPDITCLGKVIGGGLPCAAYGGREDIMRNVSPDGKVYQAGTLSGNPLAMTAGIETLKILTAEGYMEKLIRQTATFADSLRIKAQLANVEVQIPQVGTMFSIFFNMKRVKNLDDAKSSGEDQFKLWFKSMLERGIYLAPSQYETLFMSGAHNKDDIAKTLDAAAESFHIVSENFTNENAGENF